MNGSVYYIPVVNRDALCCVICHVNENEVDEYAAKSFFHWQTLKCRYLVDTMKDFVIGSPMTDTKSSIYMITTKDFYATGTLTTMLKQLNLKASQPQPVTPHAYISCIKYTFEFVLAPQWNRVARQIYLRERDFLIKSESNAVQLKINLVTKGPAVDDEICVTLFPMKAKLLPFKLQDLGLPETVLKEFIDNPTGSIKLDSLNTVRIGVLPSLRKGKLIAIYKQLPADCHYKNWTELRRHWKNMYGYRLPETDKGILYYAIYFPMTGSRKGELFIYPDICVTEDLHQSPLYGECKLVTDSFMEDLMQIMPKMCGHKLRLNNQPSKIIPKKEEMLETPVNQVTPLQHLEYTSRLSLSTADRLENNRQPTTPMSPTPSIMGKRTGTHNSHEYNNPKKIKRIHEQKPTTSYKTERIASQGNKALGVFVNPSSSPFFNSQFKMPQKLNIFSASTLAMRVNSQNKRNKSLIATPQSTTENCNESNKSKSIINEK